MKPVYSAAACLLLVFIAGFFRARWEPVAAPLPPCPRGVVVLAVEGFGVRDLERPHVAELARRGAAGLLPTRSGSRQDDDFAAGVRQMRAGGRSGAPVALPASVEWRDLRGADAPALADTLAGAILARGDRALLIVGVTPPADALLRRERVAPVLFWAPNTLGNRLLTSPSTRRLPGLAAATDVGATVAALAGNAHPVGDGRPLETLSARGSAQAYLARRAARWGQQAREQHLLPVLPWVLAGCVLAAAFAPDIRLRRGAAAFALGAPLALVVVAPLAPAPAAPTLIYLLATAPALALAWFAAARDAWDARLPRLLAIATVLAIAGDTLGGGALLARTPFSYSVLEAARFYGIGNEISGVYLGAAVVAVGGEAGTLATLLYGAAVALVSVLPTLGADAGGFVADLAGFVALGLSARKANRRTVIAPVLAVLLLTAGFVLWDGSRPPGKRTHIGQAVAAARAGGVQSIAVIAARKLAVNARLSVTSPWAALFLAEVAAIVWAWRRRGRRAKPSEVALIAATLALYALNDSGVVAGATCGLWSLALLPPPPLPDTIPDAL